MARIAACIAAALALVLLAAAEGLGQPAAGLSSLSFTWEQVPGFSDAAAVTVNGVRLMSIRADSGSSPAVAAAVADRLQAAALEGAGPSAVSVEKAEGGYIIFVGDRRILLVDQAIALAMRSSREALAQEWAARLRQVFAGPYLSLPVPLQIVPVGERRIVPVRGSWPQLKVTADASIVQATPETSTRSVSLLGAAPGEAQVVLEAGGARLSLPVQVMKYAGRVAPSARAAVTGRLAPAWVIKRAASAAVYYSIAPEPGAWAEINEIILDRAAIALGESAAATLVVTLRGAGYLPVRARPQVKVVNQAIVPTDATVLMVSNRPERLPATGLWYEGRVPEGHPARLLYHHVNATPEIAELAVELVNSSAAPLRVQIVEGSGGPSSDEIFAGHKAARDFLERRADDVGYLISLPNGCAYTASASLLKPGQVISGLAEVRVLDAGELRVRVRLRPPSPDIVMPVVPTPVERLSTWVFSQPQKGLDVTYRVGQQWAFATIGDGQALSATGRESLDGDYGVFYDISFTVENPTDHPADIELVFMPGGGLARGTAIIDGRLCETGLLRYGETQRLHALNLAPGARQVVRVRIMPEAGSNYPVKLVMRPKGVWD